MEIPNNLSVQQLLQLRELIKKNVSQKQMRAATIKTYHTSDKGKNKKIKKEKELSKKISELEEQLKELKIKYSEI